MDVSPSMITIYKRFKVESECSEWAVNGTILKRKKLQKMQI